MLSAFIIIVSLLCFSYIILHSMLNGTLNYTPQSFVNFIILLVPTILASIRLYTNTPTAWINQKLYLIIILLLTLIIHLGFFNDQKDFHFPLFQPILIGIIFVFMIFAFKK